jgi:hypothetical protein
MAQVELRHPQGTYQVSCVHLIPKCDLFKNNPGLTIRPYQVQSEVSLEDFQDFLSALEAKSFRMNDTNLPGLLQLSEEFGFQMLLMKISNRQPLPGLSEGQRVKYVSQISYLTKQVGQHEHQIAALYKMLFAAVRRLETDMERLGSERKGIRDTKNTEAATTDHSRCNKSPPAAVPPSVTAAVSPSVAATVPPITSAKSPPPAVPSVPRQTGRLDSLIVSEYPPLFEEFRMQQWVLLWRGSRDGYTAEEFHRRCDGHASTLTLILSTVGNIFGGFTPVEWEYDCGYKETTACGVSFSC